MESVDEIVELSLLYDFYGELFDEHKKKIFEEYVLNDLSLAEIAEIEGISRQGVHDIIRRCSAQLKEYEQKLHLLAKFRQTKETLTKVQGLLTQAEAAVDAESLLQAKCLLDKALEEL